MDEDNQNKSCQIKSKAKISSLFLSCFGFQVSGSRKPSKDVEQGNRKHRFFSRSTFLFKKTGTKTVPVDSTNFSERLQAKKSFMSKKSKLKKINSDVSLKHPNPTAQDKFQTPTPKVAANPNKKSEDRPKETCDKSTIHENRKFSDLAVVSPKKLSLCSKIDATRNGSGQLGSPEAKPKSNRTILRSTSFPVTSNPPEKSRVVAKKDRREAEIVGKRFDPVIGLSIVMVTLIIMLLCGRLCAILCTCAWLYFVPRLRVNLGPHGMEKTGLVSYEPDLNWEEHKRRVVLEGFLDRNHRSVV